MSLSQKKAHTHSRLDSKKKNEIQKQQTQWWKEEVTGTHFVPSAIVDDNGRLAGECHFCVLVQCECGERRASQRAAAMELDSDDAMLYYVANFPVKHQDSLQWQLERNHDVRLTELVEVWPSNP
jgi:hypothetical protein